MTVFNKLIALEKQADDFGFSWPDHAMIIKQIVSECDEIQENVHNNGTAEHLQEEIGDLIHAVFSLCIFSGFDPEQTMANSLQKFESRLNETMRLAKAAGHETLKSEQFDQFIYFWEQAKKNLVKS